MQNNLHNEIKITGEHVKNNEEMRRVLAKNNIVPENLPPEEDLKKLERRVKKDKEKLTQHSKKDELNYKFL